MRRSASDYQRAVAGQASHRAARGQGFPTALPDGTRTTPGTVAWSRPSGFLTPLPTKIATVMALAGSVSGSNRITVPLRTGADRRGQNAIDVEQRAPFRVSLRWLCCRWVSPIGRQSSGRQILFPTSGQDT